MSVFDEKSEWTATDLISSEKDLLWPSQQSWVDFCFLF